MKTKTLLRIVACAGLFLALGCSRETTLNPSLPYQAPPAGPSPTSTPTPTPTPHSVTLLWDASTSVVDGYNLYRGGQSGGPYSLVGTVGSTTLTFTDPSVVAGATYYYVATAFTTNPAAESANSNEAWTTIPTP
jgi:hypothetical protein